MRGGRSRQATCQPLSFLGYVAANAWQSLASMPNVDRRRIGITGHSYGGKLVSLRAALWEPYAAVASSDPGIVFDEQRPSVNYWEPWYLVSTRRSRVSRFTLESNPRTGAYRVMIEQGRDLHELHALIAPRPFLFPAVPKIHLSDGRPQSPSSYQPLLGYSNRVAMQNRPKHDPTVESNEVIYRFFEVALGDSPLARCLILKRLCAALEPHGGTSPAAKPRGSARPARSPAALRGSASLRPP